MVVAPPGYGKTVLLADWATRDTRPVAWLTIDEYDNEPSIFLTYLAAAIDHIEPIDASVGALLAVRGSRVLATAVPRLASELHRRRRPGVLILDDLHRLVDRTCLDALAALLELLPPGFQLAMAARTTPDLPFGRLRSRRQLLEIGRDQLAFDVDETATLADGTGYRVSREQAGVLAERTEGWAAAIYLASLARGRNELHVSGTDDVSGRERYIADYLHAEVRSILQGDDDLVLLTRTSILEEIEPALAGTVSGVPDAADRLRRLSRANLLIGEVASPEPSYRYHHLLRDYLRAELERREAGVAPELHRRASAWYAGVGRPELAIEHAIAGGHLDEAAERVEAATLTTYDQGHGDRLARWLSCFDDGVFERRPGLAMGAALVHALSGMPEAADHMADIVEGSTSASVTAIGTASVRSARAILRAAMVRRGADDAVANAAAALRMERLGSPWRTLVCEVLALGHVMRGDLVAADEVLAEAIDSTPATGHAFFALALRASLAMERRDWQAATAYAREGHDRFARMRSEAVASAVLVHAVAARVAIHHGELARGREELVHAQLVRPLVTYALPSAAVVGLLEVARAYLSLSDPAGAGMALAEAERILHRRPALGVLPEQVAELRRRAVGSSEALAGPSSLTPAELRVLPMLSTHLMFQEIAERLHVSRHTVKTQVVAIYGKLGVSSRGEAVERAIEIGLLEPFPGLRLTARPPTD